MIWPLLSGKQKKIKLLPLFVNFENFELTVLIPYTSSGKKTLCIVNFEIFELDPFI